MAQLKRQSEDEVRNVRLDFQKALSTSAEAQAVQQRRIQELEAKLSAQTQQLEQLTTRHKQEVSAMELSHQKELIGLVRFRQRSHTDVCCSVAKTRRSSRAAMSPRGRRRPLS